MREIRVVMTREEHTAWLNFCRFLNHENPSEALLLVGLGVADEHRAEIERFMRKPRMRAIEGKTG